MRIDISGRVFEVDRHLVESKITDIIREKLPKPTTMEESLMTSAVKSAISMIFGKLSAKNPIFVRPKEMDTIDHALSVVSKMLLDAWEKEGLALEGRETSADTEEKAD